MTDQFIASEDRLLNALAASARGPKRNGLYALWLIVRQCDGELPPDVLSARAGQKRRESLERRLSSLSLPAPLRRGVASLMRELRSEYPIDVAFALQQLVAPTREALGHSAAETIAQAANKARALPGDNGVRP